MSTEYHGMIGDVKHFDVFRTADNTTRRTIGRHERWKLMRSAPGSCGGIEAFQTAELAMKWGSKLNPRVEWKKVTV